MNIVQRFAGLCLAVVLGISYSVAQRYMIIEPSIDGWSGFDMSSAPQCINDRGHAAGILTHYEAQNRHRYY